MKINCLLFRGLVAVLLSGLFATAAESAGPWHDLQVKLENDGFSRSSLQKLFGRPEMRYDPAPMRGKLRVLQKKYFGTYRTRRAQQALSRLGYDIGKVDGVYGAKTATAIKAYQKSRKLDADGVPSDALFDAFAKDLNQTADTSWGTGVYKAVRSQPRLAEAREFVIAHWPVFHAMTEQYGVPWEVVAGILAVETRVGHFLGTRSPLVTLASMASCNDLSCAKTYFRKGSLSSSELSWLKITVRQRSDWAYDELKALLTYCTQNKLDPLNMPGSIYGAFGIGQFMPSSVLRFGVDGDKDGDVDLFSVPDAVFSVGAYLHGHGWEGDMSSLSKKRSVLFAYNHSQRYVNSILEVAAQMTRSFSLPEMKTGSPQKTVRVSDAGGLLKALAPDTRLLLAPGIYDLNTARGFASNYVRCGRNAEGFLLELKGLRNVSILAERGALLNAGEGGLTLHIADSQEVLLDGLQIMSGSGRSALLELQRTGQTRIVNCRLQGGGLRCSESKKITFANTLLHSVQEPGIQLVDTQSVVLQNMVVRSVRSDKLLVLRDSSKVEVAGCYLYDNGNSAKTGALFDILGGGTGSEMRESCLMDNRFGVFSSIRGVPRTVGNYLRGNTFKAP